MENEILTVEYREVNSNMRHCGKLRFTQLILYFAFSAGLIFTVFMMSPPLGDDVRLTFKILGVIGAGAFGVMEERAGDYWHHLRRRAVQIEEILGYRQFSERPTANMFNATNASRLLVWGGMPIWLLAAIIRV